MSSSTDKDTTCEATVDEDRAISYLRGELSSDATLDFEIHVLGCGACAALVQRLEVFLEAAHDLRGMQWDRVTIDERSPYYQESAQGNGSPSDLEERQRIVDALSYVMGSQTRAAEILGLSRRTLVQRLQKYQIAPYLSLRPRPGSEKIDSADEAESTPEESKKNDKTR
jgi:hypothetical protein